MENKKNKYLSVIFWLSLIAIFLLITKCTFYQKNANKNVANCMEITIGMEVNQVVEIMGKPDNIIIYDGRVNYADMKILKYYYNSPFLASSGVEIYFDFQTNKVVYIVCDD
jgi:hypothetical protein